MAIPFRFVLAAGLFLFSVGVKAQRHCATVPYNLQIEQSHPEVKAERAKLENYLKSETETQATRQPAAVVTIPVVFHVVYRTDQENISDEQILSQLEVLNQDFRRRNADTLNTPLVWRDIAADTEIEFCLAHTDPSGYYTSGITRTKTNVAGFNIDDKVKFTTSGGRSGWERTRYLNIWVCNLSGLFLGYSSSPGGPAAYDGVVIDYEYTGTTGTARFPYNKGRTLTHEVGHWLNLAHIWGPNDFASCNDDDLVSDTPVQKGQNNDCPVYPHNPTVCEATNIHGDMFMNYMDYTFDACMNLFTTGQKDRMHESIRRTRETFLNPSVNVCADGADKPDLAHLHWVVLYPNPGMGVAELSFAPDKTAGPYRVTVFDQVGRKVYFLSSPALQDNKLPLHLTHLANGIYTAHIETDGLSDKLQFVISH